MKNFTGNSFIAAAALSLAIAFSGHAAADMQDYAAADSLSGAQLQLETIQSFDATLAERVFSVSFTDAIQEQALSVTKRSQNQAEALYRLNNYARIGDDRPVSDTL